MNKNLQEKTEQWKALERKTLEQRKIAEDFYEQQMMDLIVEDYIDRNSDKVFEEVKYLVISVGTSYEPVVLNIKLLNPEQILFLYTEQSASNLAKIVETCSLSPIEYNKRQVDEVNPIDIYREIKDSFLRWGKPEKMYIDFTGGTKAMSAAAALAGAMIGVQLVYVGSTQYLADFRKPNPGSEELFFIENPLSVFGDLEIEKAIALYNRYNFAGAQERLVQLKEEIPEPELRTQLNFIFLLAKTYEAWDALNFTGAYEHMVTLNRELNRDRMHKEFMLMKERPFLKKQESILAELNRIPQLIREKRNTEILQDRKVIHALMFTMYQNAMVREYQEKYDMATLLFYRLLEMIEQRRLLQYGLYVSQMDYLSIKPNLSQTPEYMDKKPGERLNMLKARVGEIRNQLFGKNADGYLADQVSLLDGFVILLALRDRYIHPSK